jgi:outer membrane protein OmpA-like peptidoglycan-associated protein
MRTTSILGTASLIAFLAVAPAFAQSSKDAAWDERQQPITSTNGNCVRTKWQEASDPCLPATAVAEPAPVAAPAPAPIPEVALEQRTIYFDFDSALLTVESKGKLDALAEIINSSSAIADVRIHGFTDQFGTSSYNEVLANKRAGSVKSYLDGKSRLSSTVAEVLGLGKSSPAEGCGSMKKRDEKIACMAKERRVEIEFKAQR